MFVLELDTISFSVLQNNNNIWKNMSKVSSDVSRRDCDANILFYVNTPTYDKIFKESRVTRKAGQKPFRICCLSHLPLQAFASSSETIVVL